jgi:hypothetical protein
VGPASSDLASVLGPLGRLALASGRLDDAEAYCRRALGLRSSTNWGDWSRAGDLRCLGGVAARRGHRGAAEAYFKESVATCTRLFGPRSYCDAETRLEEGRSALEACRLEEADRSLKDARSTFAAILPATHPRLQQTAAALESLPAARSRCGSL